MNKLEVPWEKACVLLCTKCGQSEDITIQLAENVKTEVRKELKAKNQNKQVRVMTSGCLSICINGKQAFAYLPINSNSEIYTSNLNQEEVKKDVLDLIEIKMKIN